MAHYNTMRTEIIHLCQTITLKMIPAKNEVISPQLPSKEAFQPGHKPRIWSHHEEYGKCNVLEKQSLVESIYYKHNQKYKFLAQNVKYVLLINEYSISGNIK